MLDTATATQGSRSAEAALRFVRGGGRSFLRHQRVPYPFHITRPHYCDVARPDLATLYLQSASGGLYCGDRLDLVLQAGKGVLAHVTSGAATVVHTSHGGRMRVNTRIEIEATAFLAVTAEPYILFPGADLTVDTDVVLASGAMAIVAEGFSVHDPAGRDRPFEQLKTLCRIRRHDGRLLVDERGCIDGSVYLGQGSPLGRSRAMGFVLILGQPALGLDFAALERSLDGIGVLAGATPLPHQAGCAVRILAADGGSLARGLDLAFAIGFETLLGCKPARRRK